MKTVRTLLTICLFLAATHVFAQLQNHPVKVNIPFSFTAADQTFPAGQYLISTIQPERTILIASEDHHVSSLQTVSAVYEVRPSANTRLVFQRYGSSYFLKQIWTIGSDLSRTLPEGKHELEIAKAGVTPQVAEVLQASTGR